ncbi:MAG: FkbM family methyltransferase [Dysgonamonadaceae bacterium]|jgi:FkbM family methyltransferase|nr:FkbM family methyltransferase [Dysgonamonadaceae bacterium]
MKHLLKKTLFSLLGIENYLRLHQKGYFIAYRLGILKKNNNYKYHYYVKNLIHEGDTVIDIGANLGYYSRLFSEWVGPSGKVYAVEPIALYNKLFKEATKRQTNITLYPFALGAEEKRIYLVTHAHSGYLHTGLPHVYDASKDGNIEEQGFRFRAEMKRPDQLFAGLEKINYIKCDIEGFEYTVLSEMKELLAKYKPVLQVEVWGENKERLFQLLQSMGYAPHRLENNTLDSREEAIINGSGDYIFIFTKASQLFNFA